MRVQVLLRTAAAVAGLVGCPTVRSPELLPAGGPPVQTEKMPLLKVHLINGDLLQLLRWKDWPGDSGVVGYGTRYDARRNVVGLFDGPIPRDSIALLEVTRQETLHPAGTIALATYTVLAGIVTIACIVDPKACFGSCPTFYANEADDRPVAEGFSASVARALEATDVDDLGDLGASGRSVRLTMRNEALETHAVQSVRLLVAPRPPAGALVRAVDGRYYTAIDAVAPLTCTASDGDCRERVQARDGLEWSTRADSADLGALDSLDITFPAIAGPRALVIASRQSFITTYVFYQALAYAGSRAGDILAEVERRGTAIPGLGTVIQRLTRIEVLAGGVGGPLRPVGTLGEVGPIATDQYALPLPEVPTGAPIHVRLRFVRGGWRFDRLGGVRITPAPPPVALAPVRVERAGVEDTAARQRLLDPERYLITGPGDAYRLTFVLPDRAERLTFFLESRGYYYEWMRSEWLAEEDAGMLGLLATAPGQAMRQMAPGYSRLEPRLDSLFWASRFGRR